MNNEQTRLGLIEKANKHHEGFPQYKGYFDNHRLAVALKDIKNKYREVMFPKGSYLLVDINSINKPATGPYVNTQFIYAVPAPHYIDTSIRLKEIKVQE